MKESVRNRLALTQQDLANWLGISRVSLAQAERAHRSLPADATPQWTRLDYAERGLVYVPGAGARPAPPPLPAPVPDQQPLAARLAYCRYQIGHQGLQLKKMQALAQCYEARLKALPALRAWAGPVPDPAREQEWLYFFEQEARNALLDDCGTGPQKLLAARIAGLEREAEVLGEMVEETPA